MHCQKMKMISCNESKTVKFVLQGDKKQIHLTSFQEQIDAIIVDVEGGDSLAEKMLLAPRMKYYFTNTNIVKAVRQL
jgi:hypothetical protein